MSDVSFQHEPVLTQEVIRGLALQTGQCVVDATLGGGGHAEALLREIGPEGRLVGFDVDGEALAHCEPRLAPMGAQVDLVRASFRELRNALTKLGIESVDAVLFDLGVSSRQLDAAERGFRFGSETASETPLDMRMDRRGESTAADWLARESQPELERIFREYGELPGSRRLAKAIVEERKLHPVATAGDFLDLIRRAGVGRGRRHNPATLAFQALRIAVNDELGALEAGIDQAIASLRGGGRIAVIAYHSLEDRIVKNRLRDAVRGCVCPPRIPVCCCGRKPELRLITKRPIGASDEEIRRNPRSRSARLRIASRLEEAA